MPTTTGIEWISLKDILPQLEGYYDVKYLDGEEDSKPFRIRKDQAGFLTEKEVTHWREYTDSQDFPID
jgi:hypothetical protein